MVHNARLDRVRQEVKERLLKLLAPEATVYCILRHTSRSGMLRHISLLVMKDNQPIEISSRVAYLLDMRLAKNGGVKLDGYGMDPGFTLVYNLSVQLFGYDSDKQLRHAWL